MMDDRMKKKKVEKKGRERGGTFFLCPPQAKITLHAWSGGPFSLRAPSSSLLDVLAESAQVSHAPSPCPRCLHRDHFPPLPVRGLCWICLPLSFVAEDLLPFLRHSRLHCLVNTVLAGAKCAVRAGGRLQNALGMGSSYRTGAVEAENLHSSFQSLLGINLLAIGKDSGPILVKHRRVDPEFDLSTGLRLRAIKFSVHSHLKQSNRSHWGRALSLCSLHPESVSGHQHLSVH